MNPAPSWVLIPELGLAFGNHPMAFQGELTGELLFFFFFHSWYSQLITLNYIIYIVIKPNLLLDTSLKYWDRLQFLKVTFNRI